MSTGKSRYKVAFFALGWLIAAGVVFQLVVGTGFQRFFAAADERVSRIAQYFSDRQGQALRKARQAIDNLSQGLEGLLEKP